MGERRAETGDAAGDCSAVEPTEAGDERRFQRHVGLASVDMERAEDAVGERSKGENSAGAEQVGADTAEEGLSVAVANREERHAARRNCHGWRLA